MVYNAMKYVEKPILSNQAERKNVHLAEKTKMYSTKSLKKNERYKRTWYVLKSNEKAYRKHKC